MDVKKYIRNGGRTVFKDERPGVIHGNEKDKEEYPGAGEGL